jgi:quinol monooxygenase YgiN
MSYARVSIMKPQSGREEEVLALNRELVSFYHKQKGCIVSHVIEAADDSGEVGRVTFWESEEDADRAATLDHSMSVRASLHLLIQKGHQDRSFHSRD